MMLPSLSALSSGAGRVARALLAFSFAAVVVACGGDGTTPITGVQPLRPLSGDFSTRKAVNYSPYRSSNRDTEIITKPMIKQDMDLLLAGGFKLIRLFDSTDMVGKQTLEVIRDNSLDIKVYLSAALAGYGNSRSSINDDEVARTIALANQFSSIVVAVSVGNEMLDFAFNKIDKPENLAYYITKVRNAIRQPVTTDDTYHYWRTASPVITNAIDFVAAHTYPEQDTIYAEGLWDWRQASVPADRRAAAMMDASVAAAKNQYASVRQTLDEVGLANMPILIGETGWHAVNTGNAGGNLPFRASAANQKMYYDRVRAWEAAERTTTGPRTIFVFEAFDEPWKQDDNFWGMFTVERKARCAIQALNPPSATWVYDSSQPCDAASALYWKELVVPPQVTANRFTLYANAVTAGEGLLPNGDWAAYGKPISKAAASRPFARRSPPPRRRATAPPASRSHRRQPATAGACCASRTRGRRPTSRDSTAARSMSGSRPMATRARSRSASPPTPQTARAPRPSCRLRRATTRTARRTPGAGSASPYRPFWP